MTLQFEHVYVSPLDTPFYWGNEQSVLPQAVLAFFGGNATEEQLALVQAYMAYYLDAPCWTKNAELGDDEDRATLARLREQIKTARTAEELNRCIMDCLEIGIDPL